MKIIEAIIERANDGFYSAYCTTEMFSGGGNTANEAKTNMLEQMEFYKQTAIEEKFSYPEFLNSNGTHLSDFSLNSDL